MLYAAQDGEGPAPPAAVARSVVRNEAARRSPPPVEGAGPRRRGVQAGTRAERRAADYRDDRSRTNLRAVPLRRSERQRGDPECVRPGLARAELQAVGRACGAPCRPAGGWPA